MNRARRLVSRSLTSSPQWYAPRCMETATYHRPRRDLRIELTVLLLQYACTVSLPYLDPHETENSEPSSSFYSYRRTVECGSIPRL